MTENDSVKKFYVFTHALPIDVPENLEIESDSEQKNQNFDKIAKIFGFKSLFRGLDKNFLDSKPKKMKSTGQKTPYKKKLNILNLKI